MLTPLTPLTQLTPLSQLEEVVQQPEKTDNAAGSSFVNIFRTAVDQLKESDAEKTQLQYLQATGQLDNPVYLNMASSKYELSVSLLVQLRNRALDAYNELMRVSL